VRSEDGSVARSSEGKVLTSGALVDAPDVRRPNYLEFEAKRRILKAPARRRIPANAIEGIALAVCGNSTVSTVVTSAISVES
jgi:hypothetical protein